MITEGRKLSRKKDNREQLLKNLLTSLVMEGKVVTTEAKAKAVRPLVERALRLAGSDKLADQRRAASYVMTKKAAEKLRARGLKLQAVSGNVRLVRTTPRFGDNAPLIALLLREDAPVKEEKAAAPAKPKAKPATKKKTETQ